MKFKLRQRHLILLASPVLIPLVLLSACLNWWFHRYSFKKYWLEFKLLIKEIWAAE